MDSLLATHHLPDSLMVPDAELSYLSFSALTDEQRERAFETDVWLLLHARAVDDERMDSIYTVQFEDDTAEHTVEFIDEGVRYYGRCDCETFAEQSVCEHLWVLQVWNRGSALTAANHEEATASEETIEPVEFASTKKDDELAREPIAPPAE